MRKDDEQGQVIAFVVVALVALLGMAALVTDVGFAWYAKRQLQASADAAALAGAQDLPDIGTATSRAGSYASQNRPGNLDNVSWSISTKCTHAAAYCAPANAVTVQEHADFKTTFAGIFGLGRIGLDATATACQPCGSAPYDVVVVIDRTGSMCQPTVNGQCVDLNNAKNGVKTLLTLMEPSLDRIGMVAFPPVRQSDPVCADPWPATGSDQQTYGAAWYDDPTRKYLADPLLNDYKLGDGSLNGGSTLLQHLVTGGASACIQNNGTTSYADALRAAKDELDLDGRANVPKIIIFMTDGEANIGPVWTCSKLPVSEQAGCTDMPASGSENMQPCQTAINAASAIKSDGVTIYTIGYDLNDAGTWCLHGKMTTVNGKTLHVQGGSTDYELPKITAISALQTIASPGKFYDKPDSGQVNTIFAAIAADITQGTSRLVDESY